MGRASAVQGSPSRLESLVVLTPVWPDSLSPMHSRPPHPTAKGLPCRPDGGLPV